MSNKYKITIFNILLFSLFIGCGHDKKTKEIVNATISPYIQIPLCNSTTNSTNHIVINSGDVLVKEENSTRIEVIHYLNSQGENNRKVCVISGSAHIVR